MLSEKIIEGGLILLLIYTPLAFGAVTEHSVMLVEGVTGGLVLVWLARVLAQHRRRTYGDRLPSGTKPIAPRPGVLLPLMLGLFLGVILFQQIPLPVAAVNVLSPQTYHLYREALEILSLPLPDSLPLSVCVQATETKLAKFLVYVAVFFLIVTTLRRTKQIKRLVYVIIGVGFIEALYSLLQLLSGEQLLAFYPKGVWASGSFMNKNHFAGYLEMIILLTLGVIFTRFEPSASRRVKVPAEEKYAKTAILGFIVLLLLCAHILSGSRGGLVSLAAGLLFFAFLVNSRHFLRKWGILLVIMFPLTLGIVGVLAPMQMSRHVDRFTEQQLEPSFHLRWEIWATQGQIVQDFPIVGSGFGTFPHIARRYQTFVWDRRLVHSESDFLQLLSETGLVGMLLMGGVGVVFFVKTLSRWRRRRSRWSVALVAGGLSAMGSMVVHSGIDFNLHIPSNALLFTVIAALSFVSASLSSERSRR